MYVYVSGKRRNNVTGVAKPTAMQSILDVTVGVTGCYRRNMRPPGRNLRQPCVDQMPEIKINVTADDLARLNAEAAAHGMPRAHLIRQRALSGGVVAGLTTAAYHALVADACAFMRGDLNRRHVETLVAYVIAHSHSSQAATGDQSAA